MVKLLLILLASGALANSLVTPSEPPLLIDSAAPATSTANELYDF